MQKMLNVSQEPQIISLLRFLSKCME